MSQFASIQRGVLYVLIAIVTQAIADLGSAFNGDSVSMVKFYLQLALTGMITWRAYIDQSPSDIKK